jgi:hypothetical protein
LKMEGSLERGLGLVGALIWFGAPTKPGPPIASRQQGKQLAPADALAGGTHYAQQVGGRAAAGLGSGHSHGANSEGLPPVSKKKSRHTVFVHRKWETQITPILAPALSASWHAKRRA